jgi:hypothetical protein
VFHSPAARKQLEEWVVGVVDTWTGEPDAVNSKKNSQSLNSSQSSTVVDTGAASSSATIAVPALLVLVAILYFLFGRS